MNDLAFLGLLALSLGLVTMAGAQVFSLCAAVRCQEGLVCRVVVTGRDDPQALCVPCVPEGVDDVCNKNRYIYALLTRPPRNFYGYSYRRMLLAKTCNPSAPNGVDCPQGSVCASDGTGRGTCCYGKPDPAPVVGSLGLNKDPKCGTVWDCGGPCPSGMVCVHTPKQCFTTPCRQYSCVTDPSLVRPGSCPILPQYVPNDCPKRPVRTCRHDFHCPRDLKCCSTLCGGRVCKNSFSKGK